VIRILAADRDEWCLMDIPFSAFIIYKYQGILYLRMTENTACLFKYALRKQISASLMVKE